MPVLTEQLKNAFWEAVIDCLVQFHGLSSSDARARALRLRSKIEFALGTRFEPGLIYHDEPFYIASRLVGRELDLEPLRAQYDTILTRRLGSMAEPGTAAPVSNRLAEGGW